MANKSKVTPKGKALWPALSSPDTRFNEAGDYKISLVLSPEDSEKLRAYCDETAEKGWQEAIEKESKPAKKNALKKYSYNPPYKDDTDKDGNETGDFVFNFKTKATDKDGKKKSPPNVFDAKRKPMGELVGSGSTVKVAFADRPYQMPSSKSYGLTLYLNAVQVLELVAPGGGGADVFEDEDGFETEEDPFTDDESGEDEEVDGNF